MSGGDAVFAVKEEKARIGNIEITKETALVATNEGIVAVERHRVEQIPQRPALEPVPQRPVLMLAPAPPPEKEYPWYDFRGKGWGAVILLLLFYLVVGAIVLPLMVLCALIKCLHCVCSLFNDDD